MVEALIDADFESWQQRARELLLARVPPEQVLWTVRGEQGALPMLATAVASSPGAGRVRVPRRFMELARLAAAHRAADRWAVLYRVLWRITGERSRVLDDPLDPDTLRLNWLVQQVRHDVHRMKAFVRFRRVGDEQSDRYVAWYEPDHDVAALVAPHFAERYGTTQWSLFTPYATVHWSGTELSYDGGVSAAAFPVNDSDEAVERLWRTYYASAFNPARLNEAKLRRDLPVRFWRALPEAQEIPSLLAGAVEQTAHLRRSAGGATDRAIVPPAGDLAALKSAAAACRACGLHECATQTVFGEGPAGARLVLVGEQPGDAEDLDGRPFIGPAGEVLDQALATAGVEREGVYLTNAVKHFGWEPRGKWRIHRTPRITEIMACRPWLEAEITAVQPRVVCCLGGVAARALLGPQARVTALRGSVLTTAWAPALIVSYHPSAVLRARDAAARNDLFDALVTDLRRAAAIASDTAAA